MSTSDITLYIVVALMWHLKRDENDNHEHWKKTITNQSRA